jgi:hypothetical protein
MNLDYGTPLLQILDLSNVAEPPKLYGPHTPVIVLKTSDCYAWAPDNSGSLSGVLGNPNHPGSLQKTLQYYNSRYKYITSE